MKTPAGMGSEAGLPSEYVRCVLSLANRETRQLLGVYQCDDRKGLLFLPLKSPGYMPEVMGKRIKETS